MNLQRLHRSIFVRTALKSGLVSADQVDLAWQQITANAHHGSFSSFEVDEQQLAAQLVSSGHLTPYQVAQLSQGRTKFHLGPYLITDWLGQGGMGQVFKAVHRLMGREVAIKVLPQSKSTPSAIARFTHEIRAQALLDHENLVRAYDAGHDGNVYFLVTEYVAGADLRRLLRAEGHLKTPQAAWIIMQAALALDHAHRRGLIHRDVKPGNILVTMEGIAKVSDLGLSGWIFEDAEGGQGTKLVGTADYMAPEQIMTPDRISPVSDIYSLGCTLYYAVTGKVPFPGGSTRDKARRHCEETPWHPRRFHPDLPDDFVDIIAAMMEKDPDRRLQTAAQVAGLLEPWVDDDLKVDFGRLLASPWKAPPIPTGVADTAIDLANEPELDQPSNGQSQPSSDPTVRQLGAEQETQVSRSRRPNGGPPPVPTAIDSMEADRRQSITTAVLLSLAISIPISMIAGGLLMLGLLYLIRGVLG